MAYTREIEKLKRQWDENPKGTSFAPLAELYRKDGQHDKAMEVLRVGLESNPRHIPGNIVRGRCCLDLKQDAEAEVAFRRALELDPENVIALKALADITERAGRLDEASSWLQQLVSVDPSNDDARDQMTRVATAMAAPDPEPEPEPVIEPEPIVVAEVTPPAPSFDEPFTIEGRPPAPFSTASASPAESLGLTPSAPDPFAPPATSDSSIPGTPSAPAPLAGFESAEYDPSASRGVPAQGVPGMMIEHAEERSSEPLIGSSSSASEGHAGEFASGLEKTEEIVLRVSTATEFQTSSASEDMADNFRASGSSEFQTGSASEDLAAAFAAAEPKAPEPPAPPPVDAEVAAPAPTVELTPPPATASWTAPEPQAPPLPAADVADAPRAEENLAAEADAGSVGFEAPLVMSTPEPFVFVAPEPEPIAEAPVAEVERMPERAAAEMEPAWSGTSSGPTSSFGAEDSPSSAGEAAPDDLKIIYPPTTAPVAEAEEVGVGGEPEPVVTETMAELYLRQGLRHEALRVFKLLADRAPGDLHLKERVSQLESELAAFSANRRAATTTFTAAATGGESVGSFFQGLRGSAVGLSGQAPPPPAASSVEAMESSRGGGAPTRPAQDSLSLSAIFGEDASPVPPTVANGTESSGNAPSGLSNGGVSFDQFFGDQSQSGEAATAGKRPSRAGGADEDLDQFQNWLKSLKR